MNLNLIAMFSPGPWELLIIGGIVLLLFGSRLPGAMRSLGRSVVEFKKGTRESLEESDSGKPSSDSEADVSEKQKSES